jgi:LacI family transcriptional regulator
MATHHLIGLGHRRIAHVTQRHSHDGRRAGYLRALCEADLPAGPGLIVETDNTLAGGSAAVLSLLSKSADCPTAVFAFNDRLAFGVLHGARRAGLRVPDDLAVVGFDNTVSAAFSNPELTSIAHERHRLTVEMLFAMLDGVSMTASRQVVPVRLVVRESCGADRRAARQKGEP